MDDVPCGEPCDEYDAADWDEQDEADQILDIAREENDRGC